MKQPRKTISSSVHIEKVKKVKKAQMSRHTVVDAKVIALEKISLLEENRLRVREDAKTIDRYAEIYRQYLADKKKDKSVQCPLGTVHVFQEKARYCLTDGWLRYRAAKRAGIEKIACVVHTNRMAAIRAGMESNRCHGLPLNDRDKTHCIKNAVPTMKGLSNRMIADLIGCSPSLVDKAVKQYQLRTGTQLTTGKDGKKRSVSKKSRKKSVTGWKQFWLRCVKRTPGLSFLRTLVGGYLARFFGKRRKRKRV